MQALDLNFAQQEISSQIESLKTTTETLQNQKKLKS